MLISILCAPYRKENWISLTEEQYNAILGKTAAAHAAIPTQEDGSGGAPIKDRYTYLNIEYLEDYPDSN